MSSIAGLIEETLSLYCEILTVYSNATEGTRAFPKSAWQGSSRQWSTNYMCRPHSEAEWESKDA